MAGQHSEKIWFIGGIFMKVKVWEITNGNSKWYLLYDKKDDYQNGIYNNGYEEVKLPDGYELAESQSGEPYIYKNEFAYKISKGKTGYMLYPAILSASEAHEQKRIIYI
jgi:hypothetical protein